MKRVHIIGRKNSGKTTLIVDLVEQLAARGYRVGTIKHTHHRHELDTPGKDSHRHRLAGAAAVGVLSPGMTAVFWAGADVDEARRYDELARAFAACDLVLVEGDSGTTAAKIEVWRAAGGDSPLAAEDDSIRAVVTHDATDVGVPIWPRDDVAALAERVLALVGIDGP